MGDQLDVDSDNWPHGYPSVAMNAGGEFVVVWRHPVVAIDDAGDFVVAWESFGSSGTDADGHRIQRTAGALIFADGFESGDTSAWQ